MTSKLTREQAVDAIEGLEGLISRGVQSVYLDMALTGMRQLLAAMDSEPVAGEARFKEERPRWTPCTAEHVSMVLANPEDWPNYEVRYLYAAPQPAPVVQENSDPRDAFEAAFPMPKHAQRCGDGYAVTSYGAWTAYEFVKKWEGWNACRSAMLQGRQKSAGASNNGRSGENVQVVQGESRGSISPAKNPIDHGYRPGCECLGCKATVRICAELGGWIPVSERMPGSQEWVIVFAKWANQQVLCWDDVQNRWTDFEDQSYYADMFSHWMPLPAAPQEVQGE
ncbi:DUF551 domain-containing protein [Klebsiella michiganensis]|uniref:DUF551 domain-containing protein n=1 Tax=Klebsiella michiganensis TaxID=1134687 RepID=UPI002245B1C0|nr:DUF551 domain-containing protein [Klebsiella michiganensis]MCW9452131.1 DUF551 domain-containing protein [Klebsiella michiganensis]